MYKQLNIIQQLYRFLEIFSLEKLPTANRVPLGILPGER